MEASPKVKIDIKLTIANFQVKYIIELKKKKAPAPKETEQRQSQKNTIIITQK